MNRGNSGKFTFSFTKVKKRPTISVKKEEATNVEFISGIEGKKIKLVNVEDEKQTVLVIPVEENITKRIFPNSKRTKPDLNKKEPSNEVIKISNDKCSLEQLAINELLQNSTKPAKPELSSVIPIADLSSGKKESSLEDYECVPIEEYGMAMLRGMGWHPGSGIGKQGKVAPLSMPTLRPKGMGLGVNANNINNSVKTNLQLVKGSLVKIIFGPNKDRCGKVEGFCDSTGRVFIKLDHNQSVVTVYEFNLTTVTNSS